MHFRQLENDVLEVLKRRQMVRRREHLLDATVVPANMEYPTDAKLLNRARQWVVKAIRVIRRRCDVKGKVRTYCRKAQAAYLGFQKKRKRTKAAVRLMRGKLLRYLRRNIGQLEKLLRGYGERLKDKERKVLEERLRTVKDRIVSLHLPHIRPIVRGKDGRDVEFGPKVLLSWVDGFGFLDGLKFEAHNEGALWGESLELHKKRFGEFPTESTGGGSRMEGIIGHAKIHFGLDRIRYTIKDGEEMWIRLGLLAMNLSTAVKKMGRRGELMGEAGAVA